MGEFADEDADEQMAEDVPAEDGGGSTEETQIVDAASEHEART